MDGWNVIQEHALPVTNQKSEIVNHKWSAKHVWGEDLSGTLQGAGGIGGLLSSVHNVSSTKNQEQGTKNLALFFHYDSNGNVILLTDTTAQPAARYTYDAFGRTLTATGIAAELNRYRFSTKHMESVSGLAYYGYRYYHPASGRWLSEDPIQERGGLNYLATLSNDLVNAVDVNGLVDSDCIRQCNEQAGWDSALCVGAGVVGFVCFIIAPNPATAYVTAEVVTLCLEASAVKYAACVASCLLTDDPFPPEPYIVP
jgi:RHS repeat-associated protein